MNKENALQAILEYHRVTKHHYNRFARGPGYLDWATQPEPFRWFEGAPRLPLPMLVADDTPPFHRLFGREAPAPRPLGPESLSRFLELSLAVSAWKQAGDSRWALRCNPSSGNLHPTEGYLVCGPLPGLNSTPGVFHYAVREHALEERCRLSNEVFSALMQDFPPGTFLGGFSSIHWREAWKYGDRAFRYCQHDVGHALGACAVAAAALGWRLVLLEAVSDPELARLFGLDREADFEEAEREHPDLLFAVQTCGGQMEIPRHWRVPDPEAFRTANWQGRANRLSPHTVPWDYVDTAARATWRDHSGEGSSAAPGFFDESPCLRGASPRLERVTAGQIIRQRRSAVAFDGVTGMDREAFYAALGHTLHSLPFDCLGWPPQIHLALFVHRVFGLPPGLYFLVRNEAHEQELRSLLDAGFQWRRPEACPDALPLFLLKEGDFQKTAAQVSCTQEIAGRSAFSLGMISRFEPSLEENGPWFYRRLFWEAGLVGQMLYLAAEYLGLRSTGIGCYFDDPVHDLLGLKGARYQSLYHFTLGGAVEDKRLSTHSAYPWSCDLPGGRFASRPASAEKESLQKRAGTLPASALCRWREYTLARLGMGARRLAPGQPHHRQALEAFLEGPLNVIESAPDVTGGNEEILIGDAWNHWVEKAPRNRVEGLFTVVHTGLLNPQAALLAETRKQRGQPFEEILSLGEGVQFCMHPGFLSDQLERSRRRLGIGSVDLVLLRLPERLPEHLEARELLSRLRRAGEFLQEECRLGRVGAFGLSTQLLSLPEGSSLGLSYPVLRETLADLEGFGALAFQANFIEDGPFRPVEKGGSLVDRAREDGLLVLAGGVFQARWQGKPICLVEEAGAEDTDSEGRWDWVLRELTSWENDLHATPMADGRSLRELLEQAAIPSPFHIRKAVEPARRFMPPGPEAARQAVDRIQGLLTRARGLAGQLAQARLWDPQQLDRQMGALEGYLDWIGREIKRRGGAGTLPLLKEIKQRYFPDADPGEPLQALGLKWLWKRGVDLVLTGLSRPAQVEENLKILKSRG